MNENIQINRITESYISNINERGLVLLTGARQTGKTTLVKSKYKNLPYYNLDAIEYREQLSEISTFSWGKDVGEAVFDEIQKEAKLLEKIKYSYDNNSISFSVLLGSAQILLLSKIKETLAGRIFIFELFPFLLSELLSVNRPFRKPLFDKIIHCKKIDDVISKLPSILFGSAWSDLISKENELLKWGGMPPIIHLHSEARKKNWLKSYSIAYLERDLGDLANLKDLKPFKKFQQLAALRTANLISYSGIATDATISIETARRYIEYLRISYQAFLLQPFKLNLTSSLVKTPKLYWVDNGLLRHLSGIGHEVITGELFENYVASEMMKYLRTTSSDAQLSFYRTRSGMEIDFILETPNGLLAIEVKNRESVINKDFSAIRKVLQTTQQNWLGGIVIYRGNKLFKIDENLWAIPSCRFFSGY